MFLKVFCFWCPDCPTRPVGGEDTLLYEVVSVHFQKFFWANTLVFDPGLGYSLEEEIPSRRNAMGRFGLHVLSFWLVALSVAPVSHAQEEEIPRVLLMDLKNNGLDENLVKTINSLLTVNMTTFSEFNVMSGNDVKQLVALEMEKQNMGCTDDGSCLAEIAGAMGATLVIFGDADKIGNVMLINLSLFNAELGRSMSRVSIQAINLDEIPTKMSASLQKLGETRDAQRHRSGRGTARTCTGRTRERGSQKGGQSRTCPSASGRSAGRRSQTQLSVAHGDGWHRIGSHPWRRGACGPGHG